MASRFPLPVRSFLLGIGIVMLSLSGAFTGGPAAAVVQDADTTKTGDDGLLLAAAPPPGGGTGQATTQVGWLTSQHPWLRTASYD